MYNKLEEFTHILEKDLKKELERIINAGTINPGEVTNVTDAVRLMLKIKEYEEWLMDEDHSVSHRRGRDPMTGQYVSRSDGRSYGRSYGRMPHMSYDGGYSSHSINDRMVDCLERMMDQASSEYERQRIQEAISMLGTMSR